jgi:hypothetical protein
MKKLIETVVFLDELADKLDLWAEQSRKGGWSTHQVDANVQAANECRRESSKLRRAIRELETEKLTQVVTAP